MWILEKLFKRNQEKNQLDIDKYNIYDNKEDTKQIKENLNCLNSDIIQKDNVKFLNNGEKNKENSANETLDIENNALIGYEYPPINLLKSDNERCEESKINTEEYLKKFNNIFNSFNVSAEVKNIVISPSIITYEVKLGIGVSINKIKRLKDDISLNLGTKIINIEQVPKKSLVGIEIERTDKRIVKLGDVIDNKEFKNNESKVLIALGQDINGNSKIIDLDRTSHILISGTTGSGKSICIHSIINSILYKSNPKEVKLLMIDTKSVELSLYNGIPHLLIPIVTDSKKAIGALEWTIKEMEYRYNLLINKGMKNSEEYNKSVKESEKLPKLVIIIDEFADLIEFNKNTIENLIYTLTQRAKKVGIYLIIATERPSTNIITGTIKANITTRIALKTFSQTDSNAIINMTGAEKLLGNGDMLYCSIGMLKPIRVQGSYISEEQIKNIVEFLKKRNL